MVGRVSNEVPRVTCVHISIYNGINTCTYIYRYIIACGCQAPSALKPADGPPPKLCHTKHFVTNRYIYI